MATDLAEILTELRNAATRSPRNDKTASDACTALGRLRPAFDRLRNDGLDTGASIDVDPDAFSRQADRAHWVRLLAVTCDTLGQSVPTPASTGRMVDLADAAAVAATLHVDFMTGGERWATVAALARTAHVLTAAAAGGENESPQVSRALIVAEASSGVLFQFASLDPPTARDNAALLRPVPNPTAAVTSAETAALEASAALVHAIRPGTGPHPISDILAITTAATTACRYAAHAQVVAGADRLAAVTHEAAQAWEEVREQLVPFNDGSRRPQTDQPPAVEHALALHRALQTPGALPATPGHHQFDATMGSVLHRLATVAGRLDAVFADSVISGRVMAYAVDLPVRESRVRPFLEGRRGPGLVTADATDVHNFRAAMLGACAATSRAAPGPPPSSGRPLTEPRSAVARRDPPMQGATPRSR